MNADAGPTAVAIVGIQGAMPQTFLARLLPLERPITRVPIPPSLRNIERLDTSLCQHTRGTSRDMGRRPCHAPRFTAGPRPDPKSTKLACMPRPTPGMHPHSHAIGRGASQPGTDTPGPGDRCRFAISHTSPRFYWVGLEASDGRLIWPTYCSPQFGRIAAELSQLLAGMVIGIGYVVCVPWRIRFATKRIVGGGCRCRAYRAGSIGTLEISRPGRLS